MKLFKILWIGILWVPLLVLTASTLPQPPKFTTIPVVRPNPNPAVPLASIIEFQTDRPVQVRLSLSVGTAQSLLARWDRYETTHVLPVLGLPAGAKSTVTIAITAVDGGTAGEIVFVSTPALPTDLPEIQALVSRPDKMEPGVTLFQLIRQAGPHGMKGAIPWGMLLAVDAQGRVVWYYRSQETVSDVRRIRDGNLLFLEPSAAVEVDMLGNEVRRWHPAALDVPGRPGSIPVAANNFHHEIIETVQGLFTVLSTEFRRLPDYPTSETDAAAPRAEANVVGDVVVEFDRDGRITRQWKIHDLLDPYRLEIDSLRNSWDSIYPNVVEGTKDWSHGNAVIEDPSDDSLIVSLRHQNAVVKIDRKSGKLAWILSSPEGWNLPWKEYLLKPVDKLDWMFEQHGPSITPQGTLLMFDNGNYRHHPFDGQPDVNYSRAVEFAIDRQHLTVSQVWSYGWPDGELFFSSALGNADRLPKTGNVLLTDGFRIDGVPETEKWARILEVTHTQPPEKVFELRVRNMPDLDQQGWVVYRSKRLPSLYP